MERTAKRIEKVPLWLIAISILLPTSFSCLATSATNVAIPHISGYFGSTIDEANWIITSYMIANACLILMSGWIENQIGRKRLLKVFQERFLELMNVFMSNTSATMATMKSNAYMYKSMLTQSRLMAYVDVFEIFALIAFILVPLALFFNNGYKEKKA